MASFIFSICHFFFFLSFHSVLKHQGKLWSLSLVGDGAQYGACKHFYGQMVPVQQVHLGHSAKYLALLPSLSSSSFSFCVQCVTIRSEGGKQSSFHYHSILIPSASSIRSVSTVPGCNSNHSLSISGSSKYECFPALIWKPAHFNCIYPSPSAHLLYALNFCINSFSVSWLHF